MNADNNFDAAQDALRQSWEIHRQAFGPILEPAFVENQQVRIPLIAALNHISRREVKRGLEILQSIKDQCLYDEDKAAWTFFVGLCFEMAGAREQMLRWYEDAGKYGHRFYLPYLKLAKAAHNEGRFEDARKNYAFAIECLLEMREEEQDEIILASACTNLVSCLTMMHRYEEAEKLWQKASTFPQQPGAAATAAILYAAMGDREKTAYYISLLGKKYPLWLEQTRAMTEQILDGMHPHFCRVTIAPELMRDFWEWFSRQEPLLYQQLRGKEKDSAISAIAGQIKGVFPFLDREPRLTAVPESGGVKLTFSDFYATGLHHGYGQLLTSCPQQLQQTWSFSIVH